MIKCLVIDDEQAAIDIIVSLCNQFASELEVVGCAGSIKEGIELINQKDPDLVFLDIEFPEGMGFEILNSCSNRKFHTVFTTAFEEYALTAIKHTALDYLLKPIDIDDFSKMMNRVIETLNEESSKSIDQADASKKESIHRKVGIPNSSGTIYLDPSEIIYVKADGSYSEVHIAGGEVHVVSRILKRFEVVLEGFGFLRVHRKYIINFEHVRSFSRKDGGIILLFSGEQIPVARSEKDRLVRLLSEKSIII